MLPVVLDPVGAPAMLGKGVDTAPCGNSSAVVKLLGATVAANPKLANNQKDCEENSISDECTSHDEMRRALAGVISLTEPKGSDAAEDHLCPGHDRHQLANDRMARANQLSNLSIDALFPMALEIQSKNDLRREGKLKNVSKLSMDVVRNELSTFMRMTEEKAKNGEDRAYGLGWNVPSIFGHLEFCQFYV